MTGPTLAELDWGRGLSPPFGDRSDEHRGAAPRPKCEQWQSGLARRVLRTSLRTSEHSHSYVRKGDFPSLKRRVIDLAKQWLPRTILIEDKGSGTALIQQLRSESQGIPFPTAYAPRDDKLTRLHAQSAQIEAGHVHLPERASWLDDLRSEIAAFPQGRHDDQVDSISQFLAWHFEWRSRVAQQVRLVGV